MRSRISLFNGAIFKKTASRYWFIFAAYLFIWLLVMPMGFLGGMGGRSPDVTIRSLLSNLSVIMSFVFPAISGLAVLSYIFNSKSTGMFHSLPVRRETLFCTNYLTGLAFTVLPNIVIFGLTSLTLTTAGLSAVKYAEAFRALVTWLLGTSAMCVFTFSFTTLLCMLTGSAFMVPALYTVLNLTAVVIETIVCSVIERVVYGYECANKMFSWLSPPYYLIKKLRFFVNASGQVKMEAYSSVYLIALAAVGLILAAEAFLLYRKRNMESAGDVIAIAPLRPVFKYCFAFGCAIVLGFCIYSMLLESLSFFICMVLGGAIGYFAAVMLINKSFKMHKKELVRFVIFIVVMGLLFLAFIFDLFGIEKYVPAESAIRNVSVSVSGEVLSSAQETITAAQARELHSRLISEKDGTVAGESRYVQFTYTVGKLVVRRSYKMWASKEALAAPGTACALANELLTSQQTTLLRYKWAFEQQPDYVSVSDFKNGGYAEFTKDDAGCTELTEALRADIRAGFYNLGVLDGEDKCIGRLDIMFKDESIWKKNYSYNDVSERATYMSSENVGIFAGGELERVMQSLLEKTE